MEVSPKPPPGRKRVTFAAGTEAPAARRRPPRPVRPEDAARRALVRRCQLFTTALKAEYPPSSLVFRYFAEFVRRDASSCSIDEYKGRVRDIINLLKTDKRLLHQFYGLLPDWVFHRPALAPAPVAASMDL